MGTNRYSYSLLDPVNLSDPSGNIVPAVALVAIGVGLWLSSADPANAPGASDGTLPPDGMQNMGLTAAGLAAGSAAVPLLTRAGRACAANATCATGARALVAAETITCLSGGGVGCGTGATTALPRASRLADNAIAGAARQRENARLLQLAYPDARVQNEVYLRTANGRRAIDPFTGTARRIDHAVIDDATGSVITLRETTSMTTSKTAQELHEQNVRDAGGTFIRDRRTGRLIDVSNVQTRLDRLP